MMLEIKYLENKEIELSGRLDASQSERAGEEFEKISETCIINMEKLNYISSAGLSVLLVTQKRLSDSGNELILRNMNNHIREIFKYAGFDNIFKIE